MNRRLITVFILLGVLVLLFPRTTQAANPFSIFKIIGTINDIVRSEKIPSGPSALAPFGGKITESGTACKLNYWMGYPIPFFPFYITHPGPPIPLFGTKISVSRPGIPASDIYTFPGITKVYPNHNEDKVGKWTLGQVYRADFMGKIIDKINSSLSSLSPIVIGTVTFYNFSLSCPDGKAIFKIGTS